MPGVISVEEALERILARIEVLSDERADLLDALHRHLAEPIVSDREMPPWPNSSMDGYAVRSADTRDAAAARPVALRLAGHVAAGSVAARALGPGEAFRIFTGAPIPDGADAVVPQEEVGTEGEAVRLSAPVASGACVRPRGEDIRMGDVLFDPGRQLAPADIGLLATLGRHQVRVTRRPRVGILSTGDEIVDLGGQLGPGQIPNSNTYSLMAQVVETGGEPVNLGVASDTLPQIEDKLRGGLGCDIVVSSAGVSVGEHDFVKDALSRLGAEQHLWLVNMRPGKPVAFASIPRPPKPPLPVFGLPGNPVSAMVTFELFVRPALVRMSGGPPRPRALVRAVALARIPNPGDRRGYLRVSLERAGAALGARLTGEQGSAILRSMAAADGLAVVPGNTTIEAGQPVDVMRLRPQ
jgi:molybdopterin molybdotransferase